MFVFYARLAHVHFCIHSHVCNTALATREHRRPNNPRRLRKKGRNDGGAFERATIIRGRCAEASPDYKSRAAASAGAPNIPMGCILTRRLHNREVVSFRCRVLALSSVQGSPGRRRGRCPSARPRLTVYGFLDARTRYLLRARNGGGNCIPRAVTSARRAPRESVTASCITAPVKHSCILEC